MTLPLVLRPFSLQILIVFFHDLIAGHVGRGEDHELSWGVGLGINPLVLQDQGQLGSRCRFAGS
jgi:hypothetical protein